MNPTENSVSSQLFESFSDVPSGWYDMCDASDLGMDPKLLHAFQRTLTNQCRCWGLVVFDASGLAIGCAALCLFQTELIESKNPTFLKARKKLRCVWPNFAKMAVLFCGLPVPSGSTHLRIRSGYSEACVVAEIDRVMRDLARKTKSKMMVFKEFDHTSASIEAVLSGMGYIRGAIPPMHSLDRTFTHFAEYRDSLKSRYRAQVQRSQKKLVAAGFEITYGRGSAFVAQHVNEQAYPLYVAVQSRAEHKLELMPASFFVELAKELEDEVLLTIIRRESRICAFTFAITRAQTHYNLYSGLDYNLNNEGDLYFNLFYNDMDQAFRSGVTSIHLGQTSDMFKSRLGSHAQELWFFARACSPPFHTLLRAIAPVVFPKVATVKPNDVFTAVKNSNR